MKPQNRKYRLGKMGGVVIAAFAVAAIVFPEQAEYLTRLGTALAALVAAIAGAIAYEDVKQAEARKDE